MGAMSMLPSFKCERKFVTELQAVMCKQLTSHMKLRSPPLVLTQHSILLASQQRKTVHM